jgi:hypothetical protein
MRPGLEHADTEDLRDITNPGDDIPCISPCGIPRNLIWNESIFQGHGYPSSTAQQETAEDLESGNLRRT